MKTQFFLSSLALDFQFKLIEFILRKIVTQSHERWQSDGDDDDDDVRKKKFNLLPHVRVLLNFYLFFSCDVFFPTTTTHPKNKCKMMSEE